MKKIDRAAAAYQNSGFIKTSVEKATGKPVQKPAGKPEKPTEIGFSKVAKFLLLVGPDQAAEVLKQFSPKEIEGIVKEIAAVRKLDEGESEKILKDFNNLKPASISDWVASEKKTITGGPERAKEMLETAFGSEKGLQFFQKVLPFGGRKPFDFLDDLQPEQILMVLKNEPPYVMSTVLSFLKPETASKLIEGLPSESRKEIVLRIARQGEIAPGIIEKMEGVFRDRIRTQGKIDTEEIDGKTVLADILRFMDLRSEEHILDGITSSDFVLAEQIKDSIYTIDLLLKMADKDVQFLLRDFDNAELAVIIKGKNKDIKGRILDNLSERRRAMIEEESLYLGEMLRSDVDKATRELIYYLMDLEQKGLVTIPRGEEKWI